MATIQDNRAATISAASRFSTSLGLLLARVPLGVYFILAGISKFRSQNGGVGGFVEKSKPAAQRFMSDHLSQTFLQSLPYAEIALGALLVIGFLTRIVSGLMALLIVSFIIAITHLTRDGNIHPNLIFAGIAAALVFCGPGIFSVDGMLFGRRRVVVTETIDTTRPPI